MPFRREVLGRDIHEGCTGPHQVAGSHVTRGRKSPWHHLGLILHSVDKSGAKLLINLLPPANELWGKVINVFTSVCHSVHGGRGFPDRDTLPQVRDPLDRDPRTVWSGRHASYWNAFLLLLTYLGRGVSGVPMNQIH